MRYVYVVMANHQTTGSRSIHSIWDKDAPAYVAARRINEREEGEWVEYTASVYKYPVNQDTRNGVSKVG